MLTINDDTEAAVCLEKIKKLTENLKKKSSIDERMGLLDTI